MNKVPWTVLLLIASVAVPASAGTITAIGIVTNGNSGPYGGVWATSGFGASIGVTLPGASNNPFLDPGGSLSVASGSYLLFLGYEDRFADGSVPAGDISLVLTVTYADTSTLSATFTNNVLTSPSLWSLDSGSSLLVIGSSGITNVDRNGDFGAGTYGANGVNDIVLEFSDTGSFSSGAGGVPEPATSGLLAAGLCAAILMKRRSIKKPIRH